MIKRILLIGLILAVLLTGCATIFNLTNYTTPDDPEFLEVINGLDTPGKICFYMKENFEYKLNHFAYNPYNMWVLNTRAGDCNDYSTWAIFVANYHGYETYQILIYFSNFCHMLGVFVEEQKYNYSDCWIHYPIQAKTFKEIIEHHCRVKNKELQKYTVYDYKMNVVERGNR